MYGKELFIVLVAVGFSTAAIQAVGKCKSGLTGIPSFDFDEFSKENNGKWSYKLVPADVDATAMWLQSTPVDGGKYRATVYKQVGDAAAKVNSDHIRESIGNGHVKGTAVKGPNKFDIYYLAYVQGQYACFAICSDDGAKSTDAVYVLSNRDLTESEVTNLKNIVKTKGLTVTWKEI